MPKIARKLAAKRSAARHAEARGRGLGANRLGALPEWNLKDLYSGLDDPAIKRDLDRADTDCLAFEEAYKGKLAAMAAAPDGGAQLAEAVKRYEAIDDLMGRIGSYAGLVHAGDTIDPARTKFYGDVQERMTAASTHLLFFTLELNRIDDAVLERAMSGPAADPALDHYRPWLEDVRRYKPYQLEDRVEQLFHEKSVTGYSAWNRQFDATIANLRFKVGGKSLAIEPTLNLLVDRAGEKRKAAAEAIQALAATAGGVPLVLAVPAPGRWLAAAAEQAGSDPGPADSGRTETAAMYVADMLRTFGSLGVDALLLDEGSASQSGLIHPEAYRSVLNVADHYGWPVLIRTDVAAAWPHGGIEGVTAWLGPAPADVTSGRWGVVATAAFWDGDNPAPDAELVLVPVPAQADPEAVMKRVRALS